VDVRKGAGAKKGFGTDEGRDVRGLVFFGSLCSGAPGERDRGLDGNTGGTPTSEGCKENSGKEKNFLNPTFFVFDADLQSQGAVLPLETLSP